MCFHFYFRLILFFVFLFSDHLLSAQWVQYNQTNTGEAINNTTCIRAGNSGIIWVGTSDHGLFQYDPVNGWTAFNSPGTAGYPSYNGVNSIYISGANLFATTLFDGVGKFNGSAWSTIDIASTSPNGLPDDETHGTSADSKGNLWVVTYSGLAKDSTNGTWYKFQNSTTPALPTDNLYNIFIDNQDTKWLGTQGFGLVKFKGSSWQVYNTTNTTNGLPSNTVTRVKKAPDGSLWVGTDNGLAKFNGVNTWVVYNASNTANGLPGNIINDITFDAAGNVFAATNGGLGVLLKASNSWNTFTMPVIAANNVTGVTLDPQTEEIWISTDATGIASLAHSVLGLNDQAGFDQSHSFSIYPNPASDHSCVSYRLFNSQHVRIVLTDLSGKEIAQIVNEVQPEGTYAVKASLPDLSSGMYMIALQIGDEAGVKRLMVIK
jgi:ligand-binding sensor domain-containing protein